MSRIPGTPAKTKAKPKHKRVTEPRCPYGHLHTKGRLGELTRMSNGGTGTSDTGVTFTCMLGHEWFVPLVMDIPPLPPSEPPATTPNTATEGTSAKD